MLNWRSFIWTFCCVAAMFAGVLYLFILLVDPYDSVPFSLSMKREPISTNQRYAYPALARNQNFDSAIIGTSTARLLNPERLDELTGDNWVNLAMNSATAYEQIEMLKLFVRHHPEARHIVIGIDDAWCNPRKEIQKFTFRPFPPWMYDDNRWNDLWYLFNDKSLENSVRLVEYWLGKRQAKYRGDGYRDFTLDFGVYDKTATARRLYNEKEPNWDRQFRSLPPIAPDTSERIYASHELLQEFLESNSTATKYSLLFMPMHGNYLLRGAVNYQQCKGAIREIASTNENIAIIDRMKVDEVTTDDDFYWDSLHYTIDVAKILEREIAF